MPSSSVKTTKKVPSRTYPKGKVSKGIGATAGGVKVKKPDINAGPISGKPQSAVKTPMTKAHREARANKAKAMSRSKVKGPVQYKGYTRGLRKA